jgi:hypothetical protein
MTHLSRRQFTALAASAAAAPLVFTRTLGARALTAEDVVARIKSAVGVPWTSDTVDTFKAGDPGTAITAVATTAMATLDVLKRAVAARANLIVSLEPTFYSRADDRLSLPSRGRSDAPALPDPVLTAKRDFIEKNGLVIWRFSDHWRLHQPDPMTHGLADALGWTRNAVANDPSRYDIPSVTLDRLAREVKQKLGSRGGIRIVGDPKTTIRRVALLPGSTAITASLEALPTVDLVLAGEVREWESVVYAQDVAFSGQKKGLMLVGRVVSEEPSMKVCAAWLTATIPELPAHWLPVGDPYWRPAQ